MKITHYDINGNVISDLSQVTLPDEIGNVVYRILIKKGKEMKNEKCGP